MLRRLALLLGLSVFVLPAAGAAAQRPPQFSAPPVDQVLDLHGDPLRRGVFYETLPPGVVIRQVRAGALCIGNLLVTAQPDVLLTGPRGMRSLQQLGKVSAWHPYASNTLAILVRAGNPLGIHSLLDLGRASVRVVMPNPKWEGVAEHVEGAYAKAGGAQLMHAIMVTKLAAGTTILTRIHHRETPLYLMEGRADAGPVWRSEALYQQRIGALQMVAIPAAGNVYADYDAAVVRPQARAILASYGFAPPR